MATYTRRTLHSCEKRRPLAATRMQLETLILSEASQKEKDRLTELSGKPFWITGMAEITQFYINVSGS